ncbi:glycoside hydrolase family 5 protein [Sporormia fimetaria CBS 119925]|uniref:Glycoside hydrolase family 5 protein n=1 Tax=Sporormia fimetaria CBS 119925 TaxID=1340428 RepID=A0A6A6VC72_9PLEO|nr:glycoside hydrolase family 5 protein [Sporormia fimetaria CBS 119925]
MARGQRAMLVGAIATLLQSSIGVAAQSSQTANATAAISSTTTLPSPSSTPLKCSGSFTTISASSFVAAMDPGWNLGNTLDAIEDEGDWNNPPVVGSTFDDIKTAGFKGIRLPVTWAYHFTSESPSWNVDPTWLQRVSDVVNMITSRGFYTIVNVHHDSWIWADVTQPNANITAIEERFYRLWYQVGTKLACKGPKVAFEPINEPPGTTEEHGKQQNRMNEIFLRAINDAGGFNGKRVVTLAGAGSDSIKTSMWFKKPEDLGTRWENPWALQYHYYSPYDFIFSAWGKTTWGNPTELASLINDLTLIRQNFTDIPLIIGEWAASPVATETAARWRYFDVFLRTARSLNTATVLWDNGADFLNRATHTWRDPVALNILRSAVSGKRNALPVSTVDPSATTQSSSAYVYHRKGDNITAVTLPFEFNNNTLVSLSLTNKGKLTKGKHYTVSGESITLTPTLLSSVLTSSSRTGSLANLTLDFRPGADLTVDILQYSTPVFPVTEFQLPPAPEVLNDLHIPVQWAGHNRPATIQAVKADGGYLVDDWTQWLGPLQAGRMTYNGQWDWDADGVILRKAVLEEVRRVGGEVRFVVEFAPRGVGGNNGIVVVRA